MFFVNDEFTKTELEIKQIIKTIAEEERKGSRTVRIAYHKMINVKQ